MKGKLNGDIVNWYDLDAEKIKIMSLLYKCDSSFDGERFLNLNDGEMISFLDDEIESFSKNLDNDLKDVLSYSLILQFILDKSSISLDEYAYSKNKINLMKASFKNDSSFDGEKFLKYDNEELYDLLTVQIDNILEDIIIR